MQETTGYYSTILMNYHYHDYVGYVKYLHIVGVEVWTEDHITSSSKV